MPLIYFTGEHSAALYLGIPYECSELKLHLHSALNKQISQ